MRKFWSKLNAWIVTAFAIVLVSSFFGPLALADMTTGSGDKIAQRNRLTTAVPAETATRKTQQIQAAVAPIGNSTIETRTDDEEIFVPASTLAVGTSDAVVWDAGYTVTLALPNTATAVAVEVSSDSNSDSKTSTGATRVTVWGLDEDFVRQQEQLYIYGQNPKWTTGLWVRIFGVKVDEVGSGATNAGAIYVGTGTVTSGVPATVYAKAPIGANISHTGMFTVPADKYATVTGWGVDVCKADEVTAKLVLLKPNPGALIGSAFPVEASRINSYQMPVQREGVSVPIVTADEGTDIQIRAAADQPGTTLSAYMKIILRSK